MRIPLLFTIGTLLICLPNKSRAQAFCPPIGIETDPAHAVNPGGTPNKFNWYYGDYMQATYGGRRYTLNAPVINQPYIELPWQQPANVNMERFQGLNDVATNGWELIRRDLGYDDNGNLANTTNPSIILYNKYLGVMRVFVAVGQLYASYQRAEISLNFDGAGSKKAATLNRQSALGVALEDTPGGSSSSFSSVATFLNSSSKWFVADFPMDYDPCICQYDSRLIVSVNLINSMNVSLQGSTTGSITTANGSSSGNFSDGIPLIKSVNNAITGAGTSYDNVDKLANKLISESTDKDKQTAIQSFQTAIKDTKFLQQGLQALPYIGAAVGLLDFFIGGGQDSTPQPLALQPLAIDMSTSTTGTITSNSLYVTIPFNNPGNQSSSASTVIPEDKPYYNESMGILSVIQHPVVEMTSVNTSSGTLGNRVRQQTQTFRLTQDLAYVINPASGLTVQDFQVALVAEGDATTQSGSGSFSFSEGNSVQSDGSTLALYRTSYYDASCIKNNKFTYTSIYQSDAGPTTAAVAKIYVKLLLNLKPTNVVNPSTQQNVLLVARYPVTISPITSFATLPTATCGVLNQASSAMVQAVCTGSKYVTAISSIRHSGQQTAAAKSGGTGFVSIDKYDTQLLTLYPNPASSSVHVSFTTAETGHISIILRDALGREAMRVLENEGITAGTFETTVSTASLSPGIYYCTLRTPTTQTVQKLVITQ